MVSPFHFDSIEWSVLRLLWFFEPIRSLRLCTAHDLVVRLDNFLEKSKLNLHVKVDLQVVSCVELFSNKAQDLIYEHASLLFNLVGFLGTSEALFDFCYLLE